MCLRSIILTFEVSASHVQKFCAQTIAMAHLRRDRTKHKRRPTCCCSHPWVLTVPLLRYYMAAHTQGQNHSNYRQALPPHRRTNTPALVDKASSLVRWTHFDFQNREKRALPQDQYARGQWTAISPWGDCKGSVKDIHRNGIIIYLNYRVNMNGYSVLLYINAVVLHYAKKLLH